VAQFLALAAAGDLDGTLFHRVLPGEYITAGKQGSKRMGELQPSTPPPPNPDHHTGPAFEARHSRPGTLSLAVADGDDGDDTRLRPGYRAAQFLITTGPGPVPRLDGRNIVFGRVVGDGMAVVRSVTGVPTLKPPPGPWAELARAVGDERAVRVASKYGRPLKLVVISRAAVVER